MFFAKFASIKYNSTSFATHLPIFKQKCTLVSNLNNLQLDSIPRQTPLIEFKILEFKVFWNTRFFILEQACSLLDKFTPSMFSQIVEVAAQTNK